VGGVQLRQLLVKLWPNSLNSGFGLGGTRVL
jgi:hypothetical protein